MRYGDRSMSTMDGDISISSDPVIDFAYRPKGKGPIKVTASGDQSDRWEHSFEAPAPSN